MPSQFRIRRSADFQRVYQARRRREGSYAIVHSAPNDLGYPRIGFSVSKQTGGAVTRNLIIRRLREATRPLMVESGSAVDMVVVARPNAASATFGELAADIQHLLGGLVNS
ncbi:MAG: ribonuclease P protein component [Candidatus Dormiibacterota bacterium]